MSTALISKLSGLRSTKPLEKTSGCWLAQITPPSTMSRTIRKSQTEFLLNFCSIYVFGGGQAQKMRFNDTLRLVLPDQIDDAQKKIKVELLALTNQLVPLARTYHASCLVGRFMIVLGGEAALLADL